MKIDRRFWIWLVAAIFAPLPLIIHVQQKQVSLLEEIMHNQVDSAAWQAFQLEKEHIRLIHALHQSIDDSDRISSEDLSNRYEVYVSRIELVRSVSQKGFLDGDNSSKYVLGRLDGLLRVYDEQIAKPDLFRQKPHEVTRMITLMSELTPILGDLSLASTRATSRYLDERNNLLLVQSKDLLTLAGAQIVMLIGLVLILFRHVKRQQRQYIELQRLSLEVETSRAEAERANQAKGVFLANMSHELRTPFHGMIGMLQLLRNTSLDETQRDYLRTAHESAEHLLGVLNDILDISSIDSGSIKLKPSPTSLVELVHTTEDLMRPLIEKKGLQFRVVTDPKLTPWVMADALRVRQIIFNLLSNALKFTPTGKVTISFLRDDSSDTNLMIEVTDTGVGMDQDTLGRLFQRFQQGSNSIEREYGGTGLGLEISRSLARMMGGDITVFSSLGQGSRFVVKLSLPATTAPTLIDARIHNASSSDDVPHHESAFLEALPDSAPSSVLEISSAKILRILIAEDHPINLKYMQIVMNKLGHDAVFCVNGRDALQLIEKERFDLILLDYHMPEMDGVIVTRHIRKLPGEHGKVPIVMLTADVIGDAEKHALEAGANEVLIKPLQPLHFEQLFDRFFNGKAGQSLYQSESTIAAE